MTEAIPAPRRGRPAVLPRVLAGVHLLTAAGLVHFWYGFFLGDAFPEAELRPLIRNFEGYRDWERAFVVPDMTLAFGFLVSALHLWRGRAHPIAAASAGAALFLGVLDLTYGLSTGIYGIPHPFAAALLQAGLSIAAVGAVSLALLCRVAPDGDTGEGKTRT